MKIAFPVVLASAFCANLCSAADVSVGIPVTELKYEQAAFGPLKSAQAFGDRNSGKHGSFVKLPAGFVSPPHIHTNDYYATVVSGVMASGPVGEADIPLPPGSYWFQKAKELHVTKCLSANECVFFQSQDGKADFIVKK